MKMQKIKPARIVDLVYLVLLLAFAAAIAYPRWRAWVDWRDEGLLAYGAVRVTNGEIPHRDFVSLQPPLSYYTTAAVFKCFGISLLSLRIFGLLLFFLLPLLIYGIARKFVGPILSLAAAAPACILGMPYMRFVPFAVWQGITASFAAMLFFVSAALTKRPWLAFVSGCLTAVSLFLRHDQALYTSIAILIFVIALAFSQDESISRPNLRRTSLLWIVGIAVVALPVIVAWWSIGALPETFRQLVVFPFATYRKTSSLPFPRLLAQSSFLDSATAALFYIPLCTLAISAVYLAQSLIRRRFNFRHAVLLFLLVWAALFYLQVLVRSDVTHLLITLPPFFILAAFGWSIVCEKISNPSKTRIVLSTVLAVVVGLFLWILRPVALPDMSQQTELLNLPRGGVRVAQADTIADFFRNLQASVPPNRSILALPYQPMFYFLSERRNPTRWNYLWPGDQTASDYEALIAQAEKDPPAVVLLSEREELARFAPQIIEYVREQYIYSDNLGDIAIYVRR